MRSWIILVVVTALMAALPLAGNNYLLRLATITSMYAVLAQSWNFIGGLAGYPSFATAAFFGLGAYVSDWAFCAPRLRSWFNAASSASACAAFSRTRTPRTSLV